MQKQLTIIIPTYNMEVYLDKCLSSLVVGDVDSTLMRMLEVIIVNDGSTDRSSEIALNYETRYPGIFKVIDKENGNYGSCINAALLIANGKYVKVLDADDWFETSQFVAYINHLSGIDVDLVINDMDTVSQENVRKSVYAYNMPPFTVTSLTTMSADYRKIWMHAIAYRTNLLRQLGYKQTEGISYTDHEWIFLPFAASKSVYYIPGVLYHYLKGRGGQTVRSDSYKKNFWMEIKGLSVMLEHWKNIRVHDNAINGMTLNVKYLKTRLLVRMGFVYVRILYNTDMQTYMPQLKELEGFIRDNMPEIYEELDNISYPDYGQYKYRAHFIRTWHRYGLKMCRFQLWLVNHYMGLMNRIYDRK